MTPSKTLLYSSVGLVIGGIIVSKFCFEETLGLKRFFSSICYTCSACGITVGSTSILRRTRLKELSANYEITALLVSISGTLGYRYELFCNQKTLMPYNVFWKYVYPWTVFCFFPSIFMCGFKRNMDLFAFQDASIVSAVSFFIGVVLPKYRFDAVDIIPRLKNFISEYTSIMIAGAGFGMILSNFVLAIIGYQLPSNSIDLCFVGVVLLISGFIVEDVRSLKEKAEKTDEEFDALISSIPLYVDMLMVFTYVVK